MDNILKNIIIYFGLDYKFIYFFIIGLYIFKKLNGNIIGLGRGLYMDKEMDFKIIRIFNKVKMVLRFCKIIL